MYSLILSRNSHLVSVCALSDNLVRVVRIELTTFSLQMKHATAALHSEVKISPGANLLTQLRIVGRMEHTEKVVRTLLSTSAIYECSLRVYLAPLEGTTKLDSSSYLVLASDRYTLPSMSENLPMLNFIMTIIRSLGTEVNIYLIHSVFNREVQVLHFPK